MSNEVQIFNNPEFGTIRTAGTPDNPLFCLTDVCKALGLSQGHVRERLDDASVSTAPIVDTLGRTQNANFVNEDGLYDVILDSRKQSAKAFRKWVTSEVLPTIRKTGSYNPSTISRKDLALMVVKAEEEKERLMLENRRQTEIIAQKDEQIQKDAPKVSYFESFMNSVYGSKSACIREVVKQAHIRSETEFIAWMISKRMLFRYGKDNKLQPYSEYTSCFDLIDVYDPRNDWSGKQLKINPYGKQKIVKRYHEEHPEAFYEQKQLFNL